MRYGAPDVTAMDTAMVSIDACLTSMPVGAEMDTFFRWIAVMVISGNPTITPAVEFDAVFVEETFMIVISWNDGVRDETVTGCAVSVCAGIFG
jgi:hypothetical protein